MEISNKALAILLIAAVVVSLGGTMMSLNRMNSIETVGFASVGTGIVNLTIDSSMSITTNESNVVNFGLCTINESGPIIINSWATENTSQYCPNYAGINISNISVRNDGNVVVNVSIATSACAPGVGNTSCTFLNVTTEPAESNGLFQYQTVNYGRYGYTGGCGTVNNTWNSFNGTNGVHACTNLASAPVANSFVTDFRLRLPKGLATGYKVVTITYTASS